MMWLFRIMLGLAGAALMTSGVLADDWAAAKLRGGVLQLVDNQWQPLTRGDIVPDSRVVRTLATGHVTFTRGNETVELGPDTQIQIYDRGGAKPFTTVKQYFGSVSVEAEVKQVQHFAVQTPFLAAVVKGTRFTVTSGTNGSNVVVRRGHVEVTDRLNKSSVTLSVSQTATVQSSAPARIEVTGTGELPQVFDAQGEPIEDLVGKGQSGKSSKAESGNGHSGDDGSDSGGSGSSGSGSGHSGSGHSGSDGQD